MCEYDLVEVAGPILLTSSRLQYAQYGGKPIQEVVLHVMAYCERQPVVAQFNSKAEKKGRHRLSYLAMLDADKYGVTDFDVPPQYDLAGCWF